MKKPDPWKEVLSSMLQCSSSSSSSSSSPPSSPSSSSSSSSLLDLASFLRTCCRREEEKTDHVLRSDALRFHSYLCDTGLDTSPSSLNNLLVSALLQEERLHYAQQVFRKSVYRSDFAFNSLIITYVAHEKPRFALLLFNEMQNDHPFHQPNEHGFVALIKACVKLTDLHVGIRIHGIVDRNGMLERNIFINSALVDMYCKCKILSKAQHIFDKFPIQDVISWTALLSGYAENGQIEEALTCFKRMQLHCVAPSAVTFICCMKACRGIEHIRKGQEIHVLIETLCLQKDLSVGNALIDMYIKCGSFSIAQAVFDRLPIRDVISWTTLLHGNIEHGPSGQALKCFEEMQVEGVSPNNVAFICGLNACCQDRSVEKGKELHSQIEKCGFLDEDCVMGNTLVDMYMKCGLLDMAQKVFDKLPIRNEVSWSALIGGYLVQGYCQTALECFKKMQIEHVSPDVVTFISSLKACASIGAIDMGREIHVEIERKGFLDSNITVGNTLIYMYVTFCLLAKAEQVFERLPLRNVVTWNALISGYVECDQNEKALQCLEQMQIEGMFPDVITFVCSLKACGMIVDKGKGEQIHDAIRKQGSLEENIDVGNALIHMYMECGSHVKGQEVFDLLPIRNVISWNALISGYIELGKVREALESLQLMQIDGVLPDAVTYICSLKACRKLGDIEKGKEIHDYMEQQGVLENNTTIGNSLVGMYANSGALMKAQEVFDRLRVPDVVSWNALISAYTELGQFDEAIRLFDAMQLEGTIPDVVTFISVLKACGKLGAVVKGQEIHDAIERRSLIENNVVVGSTLVEMYANLGSLPKAQQVFDKLLIRGVVSWTALLAGYAQLGEFETVLYLFGNMQGEGTRPDLVTFIVILNACSRVGMFSKSQRYFEMMSKDYGIVPTLEHYACIVDAHSRAGHLENAISIVFKMPPSPNLVVWHSLLGACKHWGNLQIGKQALAHAIHLNKADARTYVLWSETCANL